MKIKSARILASAIFTIFAIVINTIAVSAAQAEITVQVPESVNIGRSFDIIFTADSNTNIKAIRIEIGYNSNYISFKSIDKIQSGEINYNSKDNAVDMILLFDSTMKKGDIFALQLTAKTGNSSSVQNLSFKVVEAVDKDINDADVNISGSANIEIIKKSDQSEESSNIRTYSTVKSSQSSKSSNTISSSSGRVSKSDSSRTDSHVAQDSNVSENFEQDVEQINLNEDFNDYESSSASMVHSGNNGETIGMLNRRESNSKYVLAGAGGTLSVIGILFAVFRLGQLSKRKPESDKIFPKDDNKDKW